MSGLQVISCVRSTSPSSTVNLQRARVCVFVHMLFFFFSNVCQCGSMCQSSPRFHGGAEGCISAASYRTEGATAVRRASPITSNKCRVVLIQAVLQCPSLRRPDNSGGTPAASSLRKAAVYPSEAPMRAHTHPHTHTYACSRHTRTIFSDSPLRKWRTSGSHYFSPTYLIHLLST